MFDPSTLVLFMGATFVFLVTPGPAVFYIVARSIDQGRTAGFVSTRGLNTGSLVHVAAAAFGVSAVLMSSEGDEFIGVRMPRAALCYAIERLDRKQRALYMSMQKAGE